MGTTLSDCSHFVADKLLCHWRQATVIMIGCIFISWCFRIRLLLCCPSLSGSAFYGFTFRLSLRLSFRLAFPDRVLSHLPHGLNLAIHPSAAWNYPVSQLSCSLASIRNLRFFSLLDLNSTF